MGLYLAKRITRPVQMLAAAADEIGAGHLDHRVEPETGDEFGSLIEAFNRMAGDLAASRRRLERSAVELERKHQDVEGRRQYVETMLDRIATGVISVDNDGPHPHRGIPRPRGCSGIDARVVGLPRGGGVRRRPSCKPLARAHRRGVAQPRRRACRRRSSITRDGRELHLAVMTTPLRRDGRRVRRHRDRASTTCRR